MSYLAIFYTVLYLVFTIKSLTMLKKQVPFQTSDNNQNIHEAQTMFSCVQSNQLINVNYL